VQLFKLCQPLVGRGGFSSQAAAVVQDHTQLVAQVAVSLHLQVSHTEATPVVLEVRSQLVTLLAQVLAEQRMQAAVAAAFGAAVAAMHTQAAVAVRLSRALVCTESPTRLLFPPVPVQFRCEFLKQQRWLLPHNSQGRAGRVRAKSLGLFHHLMT
jgi:hypothetical protein